MRFDRRQVLEVSALMLSALAGCGQIGGNQTETPAPTPEPTPTAEPTPEPTPAEESTPTETETATPTPEPEAALTVEVKQEPGNLFYWVQPGKREIDEAVFGTPQDPDLEMMLETKLQMADALPSPMSENVKDTIKQMPPLVGLAPKIMGTSDDGKQFTKTKIPTPFGVRGIPTKGELEVTYKDRRPYDWPGKPPATPDDADLTAAFEDPQGNSYQLKLKKVIQPPMPGYKTMGGVFTTNFMHGATSTGTPLMPRLFTYGAFWGFGDVIANGEVADKNKLMHFMTTQTVRNKDYKIPMQKDLPLSADETIGGQIHHTHGIVPPVTITPKGPKFKPLKGIPFTLPNGKPQPFIHAMWEQDTIKTSAFKGWSPKSESNAGREVRIKQDSGNLFYWVTPGPRRISKHVFGTPDAPQITLKQKLREVNTLTPKPLREQVTQFLKDLPIIASLPRKIRGTNSDGTNYTKTKIPTPFSDRGIPTEGELDITYKDVRPYDWPGKLADTPDDVDLKTARFTDPKGNEYQLKVKKVIQSPLPNMDWAGGVMTNGMHHGTMEIGTPLMPTVYTYGASWGFGDVVINGDVKEANKNKLIHFMTTQAVRDKDYKLAIDEELPLKPSETIGGQVHHTHGIVPPVTVTKKGPKFAPVKTEFTLPNGKPQPFIHAMWEQDTLVTHPFKDWSPS